MKILFYFVLIFFSIYSFAQYNRVSFTKVDCMNSGKKKKKFRIINYFFFFFFFSKSKLHDIQCDFLLEQQRSMDGRRETVQKRKMEFKHRIHSNRTSVEYLSLLEFKCLLRYQSIKR